MKDISSIILDFVDKSMTEKGLRLYNAGSGKYIAMDENFNTYFKFDLSFSESAFVCLILTHGKNELVPSHTFNVSWTDGKSLRTFFNCIKSLEKIAQ